jgi:hypothetical protein
MTRRNVKKLKRRKLDVLKYGCPDRLGDRPISPCRYFDLTTLQAGGDRGDS